jgi:hypothetical protein
MRRLLGSCALLLCLAACDTRRDPAAAIEAVLAEDARWAARTERERGLLELLSDSLPYLRRAARIRAISLTGCPIDFREAWRNHAEAWQGAATTIRREGQRAARAHRPVDESRVAAARGEIARTRRRVEALALAHHVPPERIGRDGAGTE